MEPSEVRQKILDEHTVLRGLVEKLETSLTRLDDDLDDVRVCTQTLLERLSRHIEKENAVLVPAVREADMWGPMRADEILKHHEEQQAELAQLIDHLNKVVCTPEELNNLARQVIENLRADMAFEEENYLSEDVLRDDVISIGMEAG